MLGYTTTIMQDLPSHYDSLEQTLQSAESILEDAIRNAKNLFHTPVISSHSAKGIQTRTVVLRDFIKDSRIIRFHTDLRSPKVAELQANPAATMQGYDPSIKIQLRMLGSAEVHHQDAVTEAAWAETREMSKECYSVADAPGLSIDDPNAFDIDAKNLDLELGYANFCVVLFQFDSLEFLHLKGSGHRRAKHVWLNNDLSSSWLIP